MQDDSKYLFAKYRGFPKVLAMLKKNDIYTLTNLTLIKRIYDNQQKTTCFMLKNKVSATEIIMNGGYSIHWEKTTITLTDVKMGRNQVLMLNLKHMVPEQIPNPVCFTMAYKTELRIY